MFFMAKLLSTDEVQHVGWSHCGWVWGSMGKVSAVWHKGRLVCILVIVDACDIAMPQCIGELLVLEASFCCHDVYAL